MKDKVQKVNDRKGYLLVYTAKISSIDLSTPIFSKERLKYLDGFKDEETKKQSLAVWILLEKIINKLFGVDLQKIKFYREKSGKWGSDVCEFSISHTKELVALAISDIPVGVDIEEVRKIKSPLFKDRFLTTKEKEEMVSAINKDEFLIETWTKKESVYKAKNGDYKLTDKEYGKDKIKSYSFDFEGKKYFLSVCSQKIEDIKITMEQ